MLGTMLMMCVWDCDDDVCRSAVRTGASPPSIAAPTLSLASTAASRTVCRLLICYLVAHLVSDFNHTFARITNATCNGLDFRNDTLGRSAVADQHHGVCVADMFPPQSPTPTPMPGTRCTCSRRRWSGTSAATGPATSRCFYVCLCACMCGVDVSVAGASHQVVHSPMQVPRQYSDQPDCKVLSPYPRRLLCGMMKALEEVCDPLYVSSSTPSRAL